MRWQVSGIPDGEIGDYKIQQCTETTGEPTWLNYVNYRNISPGSYTVLYRKFGDVWLNIMQDTEQECGEHDWLASRLSGDILIGGLGIGMVHIPLLASSDVTSVTIVEKEQDVIDLVWANCAKDDRFTIVCDDINTWDPDPSDGLPTTSWDVGWFDTWLTHDDDGNGNLITIDGYIQAMQNKYGSYVSEIGGWQWPEE
tara:strand:- start:1949 stop:2542 length:594 start_codon:yes stop_codon:yes gene_type:complete